MTSLQYYISKIKEAENIYRHTLHLTANENILSETASLFQSSPLAQRYNNGSGIDGILLGKNTIMKCMPELAELEDVCCHYVNEVLGGTITFLRSLSGVHNMINSVLLLTNPGDTIMSLSPVHGGHYCTRGVVELSGRKHIFAEYDLKKNCFDVEKSVSLFKRNKASLLYLDASYHTTPVPVRKFREMLGKNTIIVFDASHTLGLMLGKCYPSALSEGADIVCGNTHKTLPGPQKGLICFKDVDLGKKMIKGIQKSLISSPHNGELIALCITLLEFQEFGVEYTKQILANANKLGEELELRGLRCRKLSEKLFTQTHQLHLLCPKSPRDIMRDFVRNNISTNTAALFGNVTFIRLGLQELTRRGLKEQDMSKIASFLEDSLEGKNIKNDIYEYTNSFSRVYYSFDEYQ